MALERLRLDELAGTWVGDRCTPFHIGLLATFERDPARPDASLDAVRSEVAVRVARVPAFRRRVVWTRWGEGRPVWAEDPSFEAQRHVVPLRLPPGQSLPTWAANRTVLPLARDRPLWRIDVVDGLGDGRFALLVVVHHVFVDGLGGLMLLDALLDDGPEAVVVPVPDPEVAPLPTHRDLVRDRLAAVRLTLARRPRRRSTARRWGSGPAAAVRAFRQDFQGPVHATSLPRSIGPGRRLAVVSAPLRALRRAGHDLGVTLNDLLLAAVTEGLRDLLAARGDLVPEMVLRATVPVASGSGQATGMFVVALPVSEPDPQVRLDRIHSVTAAAKARLARTGGRSSAVLHLPVPLARPAVRWGRRWGSSRLALGVSDVVGPTAPLWLAGARLVEAVPIAPLVPMVPLAVAALSYAGTLVVSVDADDSIRDLDVMARGIERAFLRWR